MSPANYIPVAAIAATMGRVEWRLAAIEARLASIESRLADIETAHEQRLRRLESQATEGEP